MVLLDIIAMWFNQYLKKTMRNRESISLYDYLKKRGTNVV